MTKLVGQVLAAFVMASMGVQLYQLPIDGVIVGSDRIWLGLTVLVVVVAMNAVNFVDGLDGLAAGLVAIGGAGFFLYSYALTRGASPGDYSNLATLVVALLVGACVGFLPHNFHPARIFMGDSGSMLIGLVIAAAGIQVTGQIDPAMTRESFPAFLPILLPLAVLLLPLLDMGLAVIRRVGSGKSPFHPDRMHLHHRMLQIGHSHRRAVVILYVWTFVFTGAAVALVWFSTTAVLVGLAVGVLAALALTLGPLRGRTTPGSTGSTGSGGAPTRPAPSAASPLSGSPPPTSPPPTSPPARVADHRAPARHAADPHRQAWHATGTPLPALHPPALNDADPRTDHR
jgi:UDP-GlcNAc:undecaprenyl-phosphate GlcNAc-1-phosphate transferase